MYDLKGFRQAFNLTQKQLAEILKCQQSNISGMEKTMRDLEPIQKKSWKKHTVLSPWLNLLYLLFGKYDK